MRLRVEHRIIEQLEGATGDYNFENLVALWLDQKPPSPFVRIRRRPSGTQDGRDLDSHWNTALWFFECKCHKKNVGIGEVAGKVLQLLRLDPREAPDALAFVLTSAAGKGVVDDVQFVVEHLLHTKPFLWDGGDLGPGRTSEYTRLLLSHWATTKAYLKDAGISVPPDEMQEADKAAAVADDFFGTQVSAPQARGDRIHILGATYLFERLSEGRIRHPETMLASFLQLVTLAREEFAALNDEERRVQGPFEQFFRATLAELMRTFKLDA